MQISLYFHIPFCSAICHYCDFAKTANWDLKISQRYFEILLKHTQIWTEWLKRNNAKVPTVFFGGGTPGLFSGEYAAILHEISSVLLPDCEISLEANPTNITDENLAIWKDLGFSRLSIGVQSFDNSSLLSLNRDHSSVEAIKAIKSARNAFSNLNIDLIYGLPHQTPEAWRGDLETALSLGVTHLSLYNLTWEAGTVFGKRLQRGVVQKVEEEKDLLFYDMARNLLATENFKHEEVSNWSRNDSSCRHNWVYWKGGHYLGIGSGAHGYLPTESPQGIRYNYPKNDRWLQRIDCDKLRQLSELPIYFDLENNANPHLTHFSKSFTTILQDSHLIVEQSRSREDLFLETIGSSLRTNEGIPIKRLESLIDATFKLNPALMELENAGKMTLVNGQMIFDPETWFMENFWAQKVIESFHA